MTSRKLVVKADVKINKLAPQHPRVSKKKSYYNLVERAKINQSLEEIESEHPTVRKTVGSIKITDVEFSEGDYEVNHEEMPSEIIFEERPNFPSYLFDAEPTKFDEITDGDLIKSIENEFKLFKLSATKKKIDLLNITMKKLFPKVVTKRVTIEKSISNRPNELLPVDEFKKLQERYLREGIIPDSQFNNEHEFEDIKSRLPQDYSGNKSHLYQNPHLQKIIDNLNSSTGSDELSHANQSNERSSDEKPRKSILHSNNYSKDRFEIDQVFSDFSLQNKTISMKKK
ncbi:hypothetical protein PV326_006053 [Microctonus aethiopoides]|nr:hypothetical protein PV326_006053 [Microctonus aethiopoides]